MDKNNVPPDPPWYGTSWQVFLELTFSDVVTAGWNEVLRAPAAHDVSSIKAVLPMPWHVREPECENQYTKNIELQTYDVYQFILSYNKKNPKRDTISKLKNSLKPYQRQKTKN